MNAKFLPITACINITTAFIVSRKQNFHKISTVSFRLGFDNLINGIWSSKTHPHTQILIAVHLHLTQSVHSVHSDEDVVVGLITTNSTQIHVSVDCATPYIVVWNLYTERRPNNGHGLLVDDCVVHNLINRDVTIVE
ncbi:hypothetical protein BLNAU_16675 [Blattamonas nauphoetae]|uniref:Uncharacterized protein n=1 Tax=Blattamonas nauphoetae TaxID=2049346 RepID=A0ABQ9XB08_9EUKA|nr:hypothetical protein BLNAU_16675 [Blattamonas nauphoetae]